ncbi:MAG: hypothetical protein R2715_06650 [Ilumatobacteraceae bacterium]
MPPRVPARAIGATGLGRLEVGGRADVVVLDDAYSVENLVDGREVFARS